MKQYCIYLMASARNGTLYVGFTSKHEVKLLVYYEVSTDIQFAIKREKNIKAWKRSWKLRMIEEQNPMWRDLYPEITGPQPSLG